ncbi:unnamed protein product [Cuscuta campestris]|uniref:DUF506 domain-containing protein n=1 Tax=Cuscuta campestris TaxID=132261 RepID=A0A484N538_9ASTE|nr:unnamed protein product [Cuscuta campestris]
MFGNGSRTKRVTNMLDDRAKARLVGLDLDDYGCASCGSDHSAQADDDISLSSFSQIVFESSEHDAGDDLPPDCDSESGVQLRVSDDEELEPMIRGRADAFCNLLESHVSDAVEFLSGLSLSKPALRRRVAAYLRDLGYNAAVCKTRWERRDGITAGGHEFLDVLRSDSARHLIDLEFSSQFEIARPTNQFQLLVRSLPGTFVGRSEELKKMLRLMSEAARRSLEARGLHLPPWRKHRFMVNKWLGSYRRTTNFAPASMETSPPLEQSLAVKCRSVGFDAAASGCFLFPVVTGTR